jgi:hypothetical protein
MLGDAFHSAQRAPLSLNLLTVRNEFGLRSDKLEECAASEVEFWILMVRDKPLTRRENGLVSPCAYDNLTLTGMIACGVEAGEIAKIRVGHGLRAQELRTK